MSSNDLLEREEDSTNLDDPGWFSGDLDDKFDPDDKEKKLGSDSADDKRPPKPGRPPSGGLAALNARRSKRRKKLLLIAGGGLGIGIFGIILFIMFFLSSLKAIHFATVLRSAGFASTQLMLRRTFADNAYNAAVLSDDSVGSLTRPGRSMLDRIRGINMEKVMKDLGNSGDFNVVTDTKGKPAGFDIQGERFMKDDIARQTFPDAQDFADLSWRQKLTVKNKILDTIDTKMADTFNVKDQAFENSFFKAFREHFGIRTDVFSRKLRDKIGKDAGDPAAAEADFQSDSVDQVMEGSKPRSTIPEANKAADSVEPDIKDSLKHRLNKRTKDYANDAFEKVGVDNVSEFADTAGTVSGVVFITTMYCTVRDVVNSLSGINKQKETQAYRFSHEVQTPADEIASPDGHVTAQDVGAAAGVWNRHGDTPDANQATLLAADTGGDVNQTNVNDLENAPTPYMNVKPIVGTFRKIDNLLTLGALSIIPGAPTVKDFVIDHACPVALNPVTQGTIAVLETAVSIATGTAASGITHGLAEGLKAGMMLGIGIYGGNALGEWISSVIKSYAGTDCSSAEQGADRYNSARICTDYTNSATSRGETYARPVNKEEATATKTLAMAEMQQDYNNKPWRDRYFAIDNPYSLIGQLSAMVPSSFSDMFTRLGAALSNVGSYFSSLLSGGFVSSFAFGSTQSHARAAAAADIMAKYNYFNVPQWAWTTSELNTIHSDPSYQTIPNAEWVASHISSKQQKEFQSCYPSDNSDSMPISTTPDRCTGGFLGSEKALHWRKYMADNFAIDQLTKEGQGQQ